MRLSAIGAGVALAGLAGLLALPPPPLAPGPVSVVVTASVSAGRHLELFTGDFTAEPFRAAVVPGVETRYAFGPLPVASGRLRLDPSDEAGVRAVIRRVEFLAGRTLLAGAPFAGWRCGGAEVAPGPGAGVTLDITAADASCVSPDLDEYATTTRWWRWLSDPSRAAVPVGLLALIAAGTVLLARAGVRAARRAPARPVAPEFGLVAALAAVALVAAAVAVALDRHLFADGAWYLFANLDTRALQVPSGRWASNFYYQAPVLAAIRVLDLRSVEALSAVFGAAVFSPAFVGTALSAWVCRRRAPHLALFAALACLGVMASFRGYPVTGLHLAVALFWPYLCFALTARPGDRIGAVTTAAGLIHAPVFIWSHDGALALGPILAVVAARASAGLPPGPVRRALWFVSATGVAATAYWIARNLAAPGLDDTTFARGLLALRTNDLLVVNLGVVAALAILVLAPARTRLGPAAVIVAAAAGAAAVGTLWFGGRAPALVAHQETRAASVIVSALIAALAIAAARRPDLSRRWIGAAAAASVVTGAAWSLAASARWAGYREAVRAELRRATGPVAFETSRLAGHPDGAASFRPMTLVWELPAQSVLWSDPGTVRAVIAGSQSRSLADLTGDRTLAGLVRFRRFVPVALLVPDGP